MPLLKKGATDAGADVRLTEFFDTQTSDFSPLLSKVKDIGRAVPGRDPVARLVATSSPSSGTTRASRCPIGGIDVKSMDGDFCERVGGKSIREMAANFAVRAPLTPKTIPFFDEFVKSTDRSPVYTGLGANDAVYIYAEAVKRAKSTDADAVIKELEKTDYVGIPGVIEFDEMHDVKARARRYKGPASCSCNGRTSASARSCVPKELRTARIRLPGLDQEVSRRQDRGVRQSRLGD